MEDWEPDPAYPPWGDEEWAEWDALHADDLEWDPWLCQSPEYVLTMMSIVDHFKARSRWVSDRKGGNGVHRATP